MTSGQVGPKSWNNRQKEAEPLWLRFFGQKLCGGQTPGTFQFQAQKILVAGQNDVYIGYDGRIEDGLVFGVADQLLGVFYGGDQFIRQFRQQHIGI